jgi:DNA-binding MarR family transcriptional regulator
MAEISNAAVERLLLLLSGYGRTISLALSSVSPVSDLGSNASLVVLCSLELDGPRRPGVLQELTGLSSGGVSKLLDRMEATGVVKRAYGGVPGDNRGVLVSITRRGHNVLDRFSGAVAARLPEPRALVKEISAALDT